MQLKPSIIYLPPSDYPLPPTLYHLQLTTYHLLLTTYKIIVYGDLLTFGYLMLYDALGFPYFRLFNGNP